MNLVSCINLNSLCMSHESCEFYVSCVNLDSLCMCDFEDYDIISHNILVQSAHKTIIFITLHLINIYIYD